jgi:uncharacterized protein
MNGPGEALYDGTVVHARLRPVTHKLSYRVFTLLFDCSRLDALDRRLWLFSRNRFNIFGLYDRDLGDGGGIEAYLEKIAASAPGGLDISRFMMLCYPRILGFVFNPLTVYFGLDAEDRIRLVVYEVSNTFGERKTYVLPAEADENGLIWQSCPKEFYVSPFNTVAGNYDFHIAPIGEGLTLGVALRDENGPLLRAHFRGHRRDLTDRTLLAALLRTGWMTIKVVAGIHFEAAKLWLKGMRPVRRPPKPKAPATFHKAARQDR